MDEELNIYSKRTMRKLKPYLGTDGYLQVQYRMENHKQHHNRVHVIIAHCFIPNPNNYKYINHIDSNKTNNNIGNGVLIHIMFCMVGTVETGFTKIEQRCLYLILTTILLIVFHQLENVVEY